MQGQRTGYRARDRRRRTRRRHSRNSGKDRKGLGCEMHRDAGRHRSGRDILGRVRRPVVSETASVKAFFADIRDNVGEVDILVNSAGINIQKRTMAEMSPEDWERVLSINASGAYRCMYEVLPSMRQRKDGLVVNISSVAGKRAITLGGVVYCASKFAMTALGTAVSNEIRDEGVRITNVYPGEVNTPILDNRPTPVSQEHKDAILQPEDIASVVVTICALPPRANVPEVVIKPTIQEWV